MSLFKSVVIGSGNIGATYDAPGSENVLTHAHAYTKHPNTKLVAFVDCDVSKAQKAAEIWGGNYYSDLQKCLESETPDIVSICVPTEYHFDILVKIIDYKPKFIFLEKPVCNTLDQSKEIMNKLEENNIPVSVNFVRRFDPSLQQLLQDYKSGYFGDYINGQAFYGKGISNNGSHCIDFLLWFFVKIKSFIKTQKIVDCKDDDPSFGVCFELERDKYFYLLPADERHYSIIEFDLLFEKARIKFKQFGLKLSFQRVRTDPIFPGYKDLTEERVKPSGLNKSLYYSIDNSVKYLLGDENIISSFHNGYKVQRICNEIINSPLLVKKSINL